MAKHSDLWTLFRTFIKIGGFTVGGGYAMIPIIQREAVDVHKWATDDEMSDIITLAQSMPGVLGINAATALGTKVAGIPGAVACTLGMVLLPIVIVLLVATVYEQFKNLDAVQYAFSGIRAAVAALILYAATLLMKPIMKNKFQIVLFIAAFLTVTFNALLKLEFLKMQYVLIYCAVIAIVYSLAQSRAKGGGGR